MTGAQRARKSPRHADGGAGGGGSVGSGWRAEFRPDPTHTARKHQEGLQRQMARGFLTGWNERNATERAVTDAKQKPVLRAGCMGLQEAVAACTHPHRA